MTGLRRHAQALGDAPQDFLVGHGTESLAHVAERSQGIGENTAIRGSGKRRFIQGDPQARVGGSRGHPGDGFKEFADPEHSHALARMVGFHTGSKTMELLGQRIVVGLQLRAESCIVLIGQPQAHARAEIMVTAQFIVEAIAFRAMADESGGDVVAHPLIFRGDHGLATFVPIRARQRQSRHIVHNADGGGWLVIVSFLLVLRALWILLALSLLTLLVLGLICELLTGLLLGFLLGVGGIRRLPRRVQRTLRGFPVVARHAEVIAVFAIALADYAQRRIIFPHGSGRVAAQQKHMCHSGMGGGCMGGIQTVVKQAHGVGRMVIGFVQLALRGKAQRQV